MNRRSFLATLFGTASAAVLLPRIDIAVAAQRPRPDDIEALQWRSTYAEALREADRLFRGEMAARGFDIIPSDVDAVAALIGRTTAHGIVLTTQRSVQVSSADPDRCVMPAMVAMAEALASRGIDRFGTLPLPPGVTFADTYGPLRMIVHYDIHDERLLTRFDVVGGASPRGQSIAQRARNERVKYWIRSRLGTYPSAARLV